MTNQAGQGGAATSSFMTGMASGDVDWGSKHRQRSDVGPAGVDVAVKAMRGVTSDVASRHGFYIIDRQNFSCAHRYCSSLVTTDRRLLPRTVNG